MKKPYRFMLVLPSALIVLGILSCGMPVPPAANPPEAPSPQAAPAGAGLTGLWTSTDGEAVKNILVFSEKSMYWVQVQERPPGDAVPASIHEQFAEITSWDAITGHLTYRIVWIRVNGQYGGFDAPSWFASLAVEGDSLKIAESDVDFPTLDEAEICQRK